MKLCPALSIVAVCALSLVLVGCPARPPASSSAPALTTTAATSRAETAEQLFVEGKLALGEGKYEQAERALREALRQRPDRLEARLLLGRCAYAQRQYEQAEAAFREVVAGHPRSAAGWLGLGEAYEGLKRPTEALPAYQAALTLDPQSEAARQGVLRLGQIKRIAITIDDGPSLAYTLKAMDEAEKYGGRVTFFVTGRWAVKEAQIVRRMARRGHQVGNHTWDHADLTKLSADKARDQLARTSDLIVKQGGPQPAFFRPPYGAHNATVDRLAAELGMKLTMWDLDPADWNAAHSGEQTVQYILTRARPDTVVLMHQVHNTYTVLERIFRGLHDAGYMCVRLDELGRCPEKMGG